MYGSFSSEQRAARRSAIPRAWASDSMTHGPAMRKRPLAPPRRSEPTAISRVEADGIASAIIRKTHRRGAEDAEKSQKRDSSPASRVRNDRPFGSAQGGHECLSH